jgi:serine protease Do
MSQPRKFHAAVLALSLVALLPVCILTLQPNWLATLTYAVEVGQSDAADEQIAVATDLSQAFRSVAKSLRPSVVSISSTKRIQPTQGDGRRFRGQVPDEFRQFFDDDTFERFFEHPQGGPSRGFQQQGMGSGVIVSEDGYVLTNHHVAGDADVVTITLSNGRQYKAELVGSDRATDIAVLKIDANNLKPAKLGQSTQMAVGDWVLAMGSPFGLDHTVTAGIISATGRANVGITDYEDFIQTDAAINPGNSGGPLVNLRGEVIGINTAIATRGAGYMGVGFAIPSEMASQVMQGIRDKGFVTRGWLGAMIQDLTTELAESFNYDSTEGVLIGDVVEGAPAAKAGLKAGDIVTKYNGETVETANELRNAVAATAPGTNAKLEIFRDGRRASIAVRIDQLDQEKVAAARGRSARESANELGVSVETLSPQLASQLGAEEGTEGVVVTEVESGSAAARIGIEPGDIVISIGDEPTGNVDEFRDAVKRQDLSTGIRMQVMRDGAKRFVFLRSQ